ncbi:MAG: hypothetical protein M0012_02165 [Deltaproteobacteria bacterium]|nr:hypothetical protein [Deltaproteobacteria bacterium]
MEIEGFNPKEAYQRIIMGYKYVIVITVFLPLLLFYPFSKSSYGFNKGQIYNQGGAYNSYIGKSFYITGAICY